MTKVETYLHIVANCSFDSKCIYRLANKAHPNSHLALTVGKISEANVIEFFILDVEPNDTFKHSHNVIRKWSYRIS